MEKVYQGAEAKIYETIHLGKLVIVKERLSKSYRVKELDLRLNKQRLLQEARCMAKCRKAGIMTPSLYMIDIDKSLIYMEKIQGPTVKDYLDNFSDKNKLVEISKKIGVIIGKMHDAEILHGDLTTSNMMLKESLASITSSAETSPDIVLIDFGLGAQRPTMEDKAVDLHVLEKAFISTHPNSENLVNTIIDSYRFSSRTGATIVLKLEQVRLRGRKRNMIG